MRPAGRGSAEGDGQGGLPNRLDTGDVECGVDLQGRWQLQVHCI